MKQLFVKASYENLITSESLKSSKKIGGSSCISLSVDGLPVKTIAQNILPNSNHNKIKSEIIQSFNDYKIGDVVFFCKLEFNYLLGLGLIKKVTSLFKLNKIKVRNKILAYAHIKKSKRFMAFYTVSFPSGLSDYHIRKIHNTALTRIRKYRKSFTYLWVAERQKNGTLHFHMLTNEWLNVRIINHIYKKAIATQIKKDQLTDIKFNQDKYNGVDVKPVSNIQGLKKYLVKYVTKNNEKMNGLMWNCSSEISALITHLYLDNDEFKTISSKVIYIQTMDFYNENTNFTTSIDLYDYGNLRPKIIFSNLDLINEFILKSYYPQF